VVTVVVKSDMWSIDGDIDAAVKTRIRIGWYIFRQLLPLLISKDISLIVREIVQLLSANAAWN